MCNDWHDGVGNHTQTWAQDPFAKDNTSHRWFLRQNADGTVRIESYANHRCLTAGTNPPDVVTLREGTDSLSQHWRLISHAGRGNDFYMVSVVHPRYALAIADHLQGNDRLVGLTRMWSGPNLSQLWRIYPSSEDHADTGRALVHLRLRVRTPLWRSCTAWTAPPSPERSESARCRRPAPSPP